MDWQLSLAEEILHGAEEDYVAELSELFTSSLIDGVNNPDLALNLARQNSEAALGIWAKYKNQVSDEVRTSVEAAFAKQAAELQKTFEAAGKTITANAITAAAAENAIKSIQNVLNQSNVALADKQLELWRNTAAEAVARTELGADKEKVIDSAVRKLTDGGLETISYTSGRNIPIDTALRTHIVAQANAGRARMLAADMEKYDWDIVYTSSHYGARPTHAPWQGRVFSYSGNSTEYPPLVENTGLGAPDGLLGINCRHEYYPYVEGYSQLPDRTFKRQQQYFGMSSDEYYAATQRQRTLERRMRTYKRRISVAQDSNLPTIQDEVKLERTRRELRSWCKANKLTRDYSREQAYGVIHQPVQLREIRKTYQNISLDRLNEVLRHAEYDTGDTSLVLKDLSFRSKRWLAGGKTPNVTYDKKSTIAWKYGHREKKNAKAENELIKNKRNAKIGNEHKKELETSGRANKRGYITTYQVDEYYERVGKIKETRGLPDLANGLDIKTMEKGNISTLDGYIKKGMKGKSGIKGFIVDYTGNDSVDIYRDKANILRIAKNRDVPYMLVIQGNKYYTIQNTIAAMHNP